MVLRLGGVDRPHLIGCYDKQETVSVLFKDRTSQPGFLYFKRDPHNLPFAQPQRYPPTESAQRNSVLFTDSSIL